MEELEALFGLDKKKNKNKIIKKLYTLPKKDKGVNAPKFAEVEPDITQQADLLFMPNDEGNKYMLVVIDIGSRKVDAEPLKDKTSETVLSAFKNIYKRKTLNIPKRMEVDDGSEFKGVVKKFFTEKKVFVRVAKPGRHRQQGLVERMNQTIAKALFKRMAAQELLTDETSREWVEDLPKLIKLLNSYAAKRKKQKEPTAPVCKGDSCSLLLPGTKVRAIMEQPRDPVTNKLLPGKFRSTDLRWDPKERVIRQIVIKPGFPPMYLLDGNVGKNKIEPITYTKNQLQTIDANELYPTKEVIRGKPTQYIISKLLDRKNINGRIFFKVLWRGFPESDATWELRKDLLVDQPKMVKEYESK